MKSQRVTYENGVIVSTEPIDVPDEPVNALAMNDAIEQALAALRGYIANPTPTSAQTTVVVKLLCRVTIRLVRLRLGRLEGTD